MCYNFEDGDTAICTDRPAAQKKMPVHIDYNDPQYADSAAEILRRHDNAEPEANITSAVRDFLIATGLAGPSEIVEENPPAQGSRRAVDLTALDTFIEFKRRIGSAAGLDPNPEYVEQLDDYLSQSEKQGRVRMGILTDGKYWLLRWPNAGPVKLAPPYAFTLKDPVIYTTLSERLSAVRNIFGNTTATLYGIWNTRYLYRTDR